MASPIEKIAEDKKAESLASRYLRIRNTTVALCQHLEPEDFVVQTMPDVSPAKWHLAHTTWFFERFVLEVYNPKYKRLNDRYHFLFNSYYHTAGEMHARPQRGLLSRPTVKEIIHYREFVDEAMTKFVESSSMSPQAVDVLQLGLNHEQQHQELMLTDIKHVFSRNPFAPMVNPELAPSPRTQPTEHRFLSGQSGIHEVGAIGDGFCFDNEQPRHQALLHEHAMGSRLITNGEYLDFIRDGAYQKCDLWLSDGWSVVNKEAWSRPLYWDEACEREFTLGGMRSLDLNAAVTHVSLYEADAFARWAGARLPTEFEWELSASNEQVDGNLLESMHWHPVVAQNDNAQYYGDVWEWTTSAYSAYPGFQPLAGSLGEYNGKFMCNQMTVRGGSCVTAKEHIRASYRSFFYPQSKWQFLGFRLAKDGGP